MRRSAGRFRTAGRDGAAVSVVAQAAFVANAVVAGFLAWALGHAMRERDMTMIAGCVLFLVPAVLAVLALIEQVQR
jgi:hypothetical protein